MGCGCATWELVAGSSPAYDCDSGGCGDWLIAGVLSWLVSWLPDFGGGTGGVCEYIFLRWRAKAL